MIETLVAELDTLSRGYQPNEEIAAELRRRFIVPIIGPTAVGKSTIMDMVCADDYTFGRARSFTTREPRPGEPSNTYYFLDHDEETLAGIRGKAQEGSLVQLAVHPTTRNIYGSELASYPAKYNLIDMLAGNVDDIRGLPFAHCVTIGIAMEPKLWSRLFMERHALLGDVEESRKRLDEATTSLEWCLADAEINWIENHNKQEKRTAALVRGIVHGESLSDKTARITANRMARTIPHMRKTIEQAA